MKKLFLGIAIFILIPNCILAQTNISNSKTEWFTNARLGLFIHWGVYAIKAEGEWAMHDHRIAYTEYENTAKTFLPDSFNAAQTVNIAKQAGMQYLVVTAKHHDGFCMFNTALTNYNIVKWAGYNRDPLKELANECQKQGLKLGFYYSVRDWHHPDFVMHYEHLNAPGEKYKGWYAFPTNWTKGITYDCGCGACTKNLPITALHDPRLTEAQGANMNRYLDYMKGQIKELLTNYGPIAVMWFDGQDIVDPQKGRFQEMIDEMRKLQPNVLINDRIAFEPNWGDYGIHEDKIPGSSIVRPWETCMTLNNGPWGYYHNNNWKSTKKVIQNLADIVSKGGNLLLNIAPNGNGVITPDFLVRMDSISNWLKTNGESIYGCNALTIPAPNWGRITTKENKLYLHVFDWPNTNTIEINLKETKYTKAYFLNNKQQLTISNNNTIYQIKLPTTAPDVINSVIVLE